MYHVRESAKYTKQLKKIAKSYRSIKSDIGLFLDRLEQGDFSPDDAMQGFNQKVYKARIASSDQNKGKSGGFRVVYYVITDNQEIILLSIYAKAKQDTISTKTIAEIKEKLIKQPI